MAVKKKARVETLVNSVWFRNRDSRKHGLIMGTIGELTKKVQSGRLLHWLHAEESCTKALKQTKRVSGQAAVRR